MTTTTYSLTWDLDVFFKDGSNSEEFRNFLEKIKEEIISFNNEVDNWDSIQVLHEEAKIFGITKKVTNKLTNAYSSWCICKLFTSSKYIG